MDNKKQINFEGRGKLTIEYHEYTDEIGQKIAKFLKDTVGEVVQDVRGWLLERGLIDAKGTLLQRPKKAILQDGEAVFDDSLIQGMDRVELEGGHLDSDLKAKNIILRGGDYSNVQITADNVIITGPFSAKKIITNELSASDTELSAPIHVLGDAQLVNSTNKNTLYVEGELENIGETIINEGANVGSMHNYCVEGSYVSIKGGLVRKDMHNLGRVKVYAGQVNGHMYNHGKPDRYESEVEIHGGQVGVNIHCTDKTKLYNAKSSKIDIEQGAQILGHVDGSILPSGKERLKIGPRASFSERAINLLPKDEREAINWYLGTGNRMKV